MFLPATCTVHMYLTHTRIQTLYNLRTISPRAVSTNRLHFLSSLFNRQARVGISSIDWTAIFTSRYTYIDFVLWTLIILLLSSYCCSSNINSMVNDQSLDSIGLLVVSALIFYLNYYCYYFLSSGCGFCNIHDIVYQTTKSQSGYNIYDIVINI